MVFITLILSWMIVYYNIIIINTVIKFGIQSHNYAYEQREHFYRVHITVLPCEGGYA
jgi:hypothetical protein